MIQSNFLVLLMCLTGWTAVYAYDLGCYSFQSTLQLITARPRYLIKPSLRIYPKAIESLRPPEISTLININTAGLKELQALPTIGPTRAESILKYREALQLKQFESIEQLLEISEISTQVFGRIRAYIVI